MLKKFFFSAVIFSLVGGFCLASPASAAGASLYFSPSASAQSVGGKFTVAVKMNTNGQPINAAQGTISFDKNLLRVVSVSQNASIFAFWTELPAFSNSVGTIDFGGGIPHPGYNGSGGGVFSVVFEALRAGTAEVNFVSGAVLADDGRGTNILTAMGGASFSITPALIAPGAPSIAPAEEPSGQGKASLLEPIINSDTNPDQEKWYRDRQVKFSWKLNEGLEGVSVAFDKNPATDPGDKSDGLFDSKEYIAESDGVWYFHIKFKDKNNWGTVAHRQVRIDTAPPEPFEAWSKQEDPNDWPTIFFKTIDKLSGLARYSVIINNLKSEPFIISPDKDSLKISDLEVGQHKVMVRAVDEAGNESFATVELEIRPILEPKVENYSQEFSTEDKFFASGTSLPEAKVNLYIKKDGEEKTNTQSTVSDKNGNWSFILGEKLPNGRYVFTVEVVNANGLKSRSSTPLSFLVTPPVFARFGSLVINYFTVFASLLFVIVLIIFLAVLTAKVLRRRLRKETVEIEEVLEKHLEILKSSLNSEASALARLSKDKAPVSGRQPVSVKSGARADFSKEVISFRDRFEEKINDTGRKIMKEVKDVEKILK